MATYFASIGCDPGPGDLQGTGIISSPDSDGFGGLREIRCGGNQPVTLPTGATSCFLEAHDEVAMTACVIAPGRVAFGFGLLVGRRIAADAR